MKLLITTQAVDMNDPILGFFHRWIEEFATHADAVTVLALRAGEYALPKNVEIVALRPMYRRGRLRTALRLLTESWKRRRAYDAVFVHMTMENILVAGWLWKLLGKRIVLWYTHGTVSFRLRAAIPFVDVVCTASTESMRVATGKKRVVGHGMDLGALPLLPPPSVPGLSLVTVGRVAPVKRIEIMIEALAQLPTTAPVLRIAGEGDAAYIETLRALARSHSLESRVVFLGSVRHDELKEFYEDTHLFLHTSATGSLDKAPLEALACGVPVLTTNQELAGAGCPAVFGTDGSTSGVARSIEELTRSAPWNQEPVRRKAREWVRSHHDLSSLVGRLVQILKV